MPILKIKCRTLLGRLTSKEKIESILTVIAKESGFFIVNHKELLLSVPQCVVIRDQDGTGTNGLYRLQQSLNAFLSYLKGVLLPSNVRQVVSVMERKGFVSFKVVEVNCTITRKGNRRGMCTYYYRVYPIQPLATMFGLIFLDDAYEESFSFHSLKNKLLVSIGFNKSHKVFWGTWRPCNRKKGKSGLYVQVFVCLEGPVAECYENEIITLGNHAYSTRGETQHLVGDLYFSLVFTANNDSNYICACSIIFSHSNPCPTDTS